MSQPLNVLLWWGHANLLWSGNAVETLSQTGQQVFLPTGLGLVCQGILPEPLAGVQGHSMEPQQHVFLKLTSSK